MRSFQILQQSLSLLGGSLAVSRYIFKKHPETKFIISDIDESLVSFCNEMCLNSEEILTNVKALSSSIHGKDEYNEMVKIKKTENYLLTRIWSNFRLGLYPGEFKRDLEKYKRQISDTNKFFKANKYLNIDYKELINSLDWNDESIFVFIDPPYVNSTGNCFYNSTSVDWEFLIDYIKKTKNKIMVVVNGDIFMLLAFRDYLKMNYIHYDKTYSVSKIKTKHYLFTNY